jgi:hypothetical protein
VRGRRAITFAAMALFAGHAGAAQAAVPDECDAGRPAVAYHAGDRVAAPPAGRRLVPCRYDAHVRALEPSLGFTRDGRALFQGWELRSGAPNGAPPVPRVKRSDTALKEWSDVSPLGPATSLDPFLVVDRRTGRAFSVNFLANGQPNCATIASSDDAGDHWTTSPAACSGFDGESIGVGPPVSSTPIAYPDIVYYCTGTTPGSSPPTTTPICSKSLDGGVTFVPTGTAPYPVADQDAENDKFGPWAGNPIVAGDGSVYVPKRLAGQPEVAISRDEGLTWQRVRVASNGASGAASRMAVDDRDNLFYAWTGDDHLAYLAVSRDRGESWGAPIPLAPPGVREAALPRPAADGTGRVAIAYMGSTDSPGTKPFYEYCNYLLGPCSDGNYAGVTWNGYLTVIEDALAERPLLETATINPPDQPMLIGGCSADGACKAVLDFLDAAFGPGGDAFGAYSDDCAIERDFTPAFGADFGRCGDNVGEGVVGRLTPVAAGTTRGCVRQTTVAFRLHRVPGTRIVRVEVFVNGRRRLRRTGRDIRRVALTGLPRAGRLRVRIVATHSTGAKIVSTRVWRGCRKGRPTLRHVRRR